MGIKRRFLELWLLYKLDKNSTELEIKNLLSDLKHTGSTIENLLGTPLVNKDILEIGPGQRFKQALFFGSSNRLTAIDLDDIEVHGIAGWFKLWTNNGSVRFIKTAGRKVLGSDRAFKRAYEKLHPAARRANINFLRRDAADTGLPDLSFDVTISFSVLEHIPDPRLIIMEMIRLTKPGGVFFHVIHIYTSDSGAHDPRSFQIPHPDFPSWCHLRASTLHLSAGNCFINKLKLDDWLDIAAEKLPGCSIQYLFAVEESGLKNDLKKVRLGGELAEYRDDELLTNCLILTWKKPLM